MKEKKQLVKICIITSIISLFFSAYFYNICSFIKDLFMGIFGSSTATLIVFIYEYRNCKRETILDYCDLIDEVFYLYEHIFILIKDSQTNEILEGYISHENGKSGIENLVDTYIQLVEYIDKIIIQYNKFDFFTDIISPKQWWNENHYVWITEKPKDKNLRKKIRLEAKERYYTKYTGKHKKIIYDKIQSPILYYLYDISFPARNMFKWYRNGNLSLESECINILLNLQEKFAEKDNEGVLRFPVPEWKHNNDRLRNSTNGGKVFWKLK